MKLKYLQYLFLAGFFILSYCAEAQINNESQGNAFYLNINNVGSEVYHIQDEYLSLQYTDNYGEEDLIYLRIYNWKQEELASYQLHKTYGINYFNVPLKPHLQSIGIGEVFSGVLEDESGYKHKFFARKALPPKLAEPGVEIYVNPIALDCEGVDPFLVEFYGMIEGGKPPFTVNWYVMNKEKDGLLNQPLEEIIKRPGHTSVIQVDSKPDYYVLLNVLDGCGNEMQRVVHMTCKDALKKINTIFIEKLPSNSGLMEKP